MSKWTFGAPVVLALSVASSAGTAAGAPAITTTPTGSADTLAGSVYSVTGSGVPGSNATNLDVYNFDNAVNAAFGGDSSVPGSVVSVPVTFSANVADFANLMGALSASAPTMLICTLGAGSSGYSYDYTPATGCRADIPPISAPN